MIAFDNFCTVGYRNEYSTKQAPHKHCHFNRTKSPLYLVKHKIPQNGRPLTAERSVIIVPNFRTKSFNVPFVSFTVC